MTETPAQPAPTDFLPVLATGRWFAALPQTMADALVGMAQVRQLHSGEALFLRGGPPCGLYALVRGAVRISGTGGPRDAAREALLTLIEPPMWFGEIAVFDGSVRTHDAHAAEPCTVLNLPQASVLVWLAAHPAHWRDLALLMADKLRIAFITMEEQALLPAPQRVARRLVLMAEGYGQWHAGDQSRRVLEVSQEQLAMMLALSRQTTNQILKDLQTRKLVHVQRGAVEVLDLPGLRAASQ